jgi:hypothetical protein
VVVTPAVISEPMRLRLSRDRELILPVAMSAADVAALVHAIEGAS